MISSHSKTRFRHDIIIVARLFIAYKFSSLPYPIAQHTSLTSIRISIKMRVSAIFFAGLATVALAAPVEVSLINLALLGV